MTTADQTRENKDSIIIEIQMLGQTVLPKSIKECSQFISTKRDFTKQLNTSVELDALLASNSEDREVEEKIMTQIQEH